MSELRRLLDSDSDELALALLRSAGDDSPSNDSLEAAAVALGIGTGLGGVALLGSGLRTAAGSGLGAGGAAASYAAASAAQASTVAALTFGAVAKQVGIGLMAGVLAMGGLELAIDGPLSSSALPAQKASFSPPRPAAEPRAHGAGTASPGSVPPSSTTESGTSAAAPGVNNESAKEGAPARVTRRRAVASGAAAAAVAQAAPSPQAEAAASAPVVEPEVEKPPAAVALNKSLAAEVALLDRARSALLAQNASVAQRALDQYRKERETGILDPEATVLQIQVLEKLGNRAAAARLARQFIASHPESRHVDSLRVLAAEAP